MRGQGLESSGLGYEEVVGFCEYGNESSVFIKVQVSSWQAEGLFAVQVGLWAMDLDNVKLRNNVKAIQVPSPIFCLLLRSVVLYRLISYAIYLTTLQ
jgi:hypothetical protein